MAKYKNGHDLRLALKIGTQSQAAYLAAAKDCSINGSANFEDITTKDTAAGVTEEDLINTSYEITASSLVVNSGDVAKWLAAVGKTVEFTYVDCEGGKAVATATELCSGSANITSVSHKATDGSKATLDISLKTTGEVGFGDGVAAQAE